MKYSEIRDDLQTGDIVLFSGKGAVSWLIKSFTRSRFSHVGMLVVLPKYGINVIFTAESQKGSDAVLLFESTSLSKSKDIVTGKLKEGVQLVSLRSRLRGYNGKIAIRMVFDDPVDINSFMKFRDTVKDKQYEKSKWELFKSAWDGWFGSNKKDLSSIFCSELIAEFWQVIGRISRFLPSNEYIPDDFDGKIALQRGRWGNLIEIEV